MRLKPLYDGYTVKLPNGHGEMEDIGELRSSRAVARLVEAKAFLYEDEEGTLSVRLEPKSRGSEVGYWVAYKRSQGRLYKAYVCDAYALDPYDLDVAARRLFERIDDMQRELCEADNLQTSRTERHTHG